MRISRLTVVLVALGCATVQTLAQGADLADVPVRLDTAEGDAGPRIELVADTTPQGAAAVPAVPAAPVVPKAPAIPAGKAAPAPQYPSTTPAAGKAATAPALAEPALTEPVLVDGEGAATVVAEGAGDPAGEEPAAPQPWHLPEPTFLQNLGIKQFGWLEQGLTFNSLGSESRWNGPVFCNDQANDYEMNQFWMGWEKPVKTDGCGFDVGGRIDLMYGSDWRYGRCNGLETNLDATDQVYGFILPQFYLEVGYDDLTVRMGHYAPSIGYEVVAAPGNFFYSHSYALGYSEPVLVTGVSADYKLNQYWNIIGGFHDGFNAFVDPNGMLHSLGGAKWHNDEHKVSLSFMLDIGPQFASNNNQYLYSLVFKKQVTEKLLYAFEHVMGGTENLPAPGQYAKWYGLDQYLLYTLNPTWSAGARVEFFCDEDGTRVGGLGSAGIVGWPEAGGFAGTFTEATLGLNWHPHPNFVVRPECRWDSYSGSKNANGQQPFGNGDKESQFLFAGDVIFSF